MTTKKALSVVVDRWQPIFIEALRTLGHVGKACEVAKISRNTAYIYRRNDPQFAKDWDTAIEDAAWSLEDEAWRRAREGVDEPIIYKGQIIATQKRYSDTLLMFMLKGIKPDKFAEKFLVRLDPDQFAILKKHGLTPMQAMEQLINALDEDKVEVDAQR